MKWFIIFAALISTSAIAGQSVRKAHDTGDLDVSIIPVDQEMIDLLHLREEQIGEYLKIIQGQRRAFLLLSGVRWQKQLEVYEQTIELLKPVLNDVQLAQFAGYVGCLVEERQPGSQISMK
jgi:hypothetical protein